MDLNDFSVFVAQWGVNPPTAAEVIGVAQHAESLGFSSLGVPHVPILPHGDERPEGSAYGSIPDKYKDYQCDALVLVPLLIQATHRIRVGFNILVTPWLHPFAWAKYLASLDEASGGRVIAGFGLGYAPPGGPTKSLDNLGIDGRRRAAMSEEALEEIRTLWSSPEAVSFEGRFFQGRDLVVEPKPVQKPYPEMWWAGDAERSVARAARFADYLELNWQTVSTVEARMKALKAENVKVGGHTQLASLMYAEVRTGRGAKGELSDRYMSLVHSEDRLETVIFGSPEECAKKIRLYRDAGVAHFALDFGRHGLDGMDIIHRQLDAFAGDVAPLL